MRRFLDYQNQCLKKVEIVEKVINGLGLGHVKKSFVGEGGTRGISGGESKRVAVGVELVTNPQLIFLDEPTSGLDAFTAYNLVEIFSQLVKTENKTVLMTIHQPRSNILNLFDKILLLSQGQVDFFGKPQDALEHFESLGYECPTMENPADFVLDITSVDYRTEKDRLKTKERSDGFIIKWNEIKPKIIEKELQKSA